MKYVYSFGSGAAEGDASMKDLLGGKGANLAEMTRLDFPVPPGFTITTEVCNFFQESGGKYPEGLEAQVREAIGKLEEQMDAKFGDPERPLLVSVRSGARVSMPGMMDTVLNLGLNDTVKAGLATRTENPRFAADSFRRFIQMYSDVVMNVPRDVLEQLLERAKDGAGVYSDTELSTEELDSLIEIFKQKVVQHAGQSFPQDPWDQLWGSVGAVFRSFYNRRAVSYRNAHNIPHDIGTAVNIQAMVFGNMGDNCATGVAFTRDPTNGKRRFFGEWLPNAQGEDVVAGIRTPQPINSDSGTMPGEVTLETAMPTMYAELVDLYGRLERHYTDMQDIEFTIENGKLWMLQTRTGKRSPAAEVKIAVDMANEGLIDRATAISRVRPPTLDKLLHPRLDPDAERTVIAQGLGASPGASTGRIVFSADDAVEWAARGEEVILIRHETSPEDVHGMMSSQGILTATGGMTSHAAVVARGMSKTAIVGCGELHIHYDKREVRVRDLTLKEGDTITLDGTEGTVMLGRIKTIKPESTPEMSEFLGWVREMMPIEVFTNADNAHDAKIARDFGASGIGLCRTEHMFFDEERIQKVREMILAEDEAGRRKALEAIQPMQKGDFKDILRVMEGLPVTIRLLDPPLHEFLPQTEREIRTIADELGVPFELLDARNKGLHEVNPMLGHRGCRLGLTYPEIYEMQTRAIVEAAAELTKEEGLTVHPEIMIPLVSHVRELTTLREVVQATINRVLGEYELELEILIGTMIELPRACITADEIGAHADFFSFGTNDLTQTTFGISRDDGGRFLPLYQEMGLLPTDPFMRVDPAVGELMRIAVTKGRSVKPDLRVGICGEQGGDPESVAFCLELGLNYVSCSPFRVPIAELAAAQAALALEKNA